MRHLRCLRAYIPILVHEEVGGPRTGCWHVTFCQSKHDLLASVHVSRPCLIKGCTYAIYPPSKVLSRELLLSVTLQQTF